MVHTENHLLNTSVMKLKKFLQKIHHKEVITDEQIVEVKQLVSSLGVDSDGNMPNTRNKSPNPYPIYESIQNLCGTETNTPSTDESKLIISSLKEPEEVIYATIRKTPTLSAKRVRLNFETFQQNVRNEIEKNPTSPHLFSEMVTPKTCKAKIYSSPNVEKLQLTEKNIESFKNYVNNNLFNSTFKSIGNDESLIIQNIDALDFKTKNNTCDKALSQEERFVVNIYESRQSKRWQKKIISKNNLGIHDNNFPAVTRNSVTDNQSANIDLGMCNNSNKSECLENYCSTLSTTHAANSVSNVEVENDIYHTLEDRRSTYSQPGNVTTNSGSKLIETTHITDAVAPPSFNNYTMADEAPYYSTVNQEVEEIESSLQNNEDEFFRLKQEADVQCNIMKQAYKAIEACRSTKKFCNSAEKVMAEKILLLASTKHTNLIQTIRASQYDNVLLTPTKNTGRQQINNQPRIGKTTISNVCLPLNHTWLSSNHNSTKYLNWFLVVASEGDRMLSSETVLLKPGDKHIEVKRVFEFERLDAEFRVEMNVFHIRLRSDEKCRVELGFNKRVSTICRSFRKLHYKDLQTQTLVSNNIPSSGFTKCGSIMITVHDLLSNRVNWKLNLHNPQTSPSNNRTSTITSMTHMHGRQGSILNKVQEYVIPIEDTCSMDVNVQKADLQISRSGFFTVGTESSKGTILWNRRYCVLDGTNLHFYNDPLEADFYKDCGVTVSLKNSLTTSIDVAPASVCPKPKTLMLDTLRAAKDNVRLRHFLKADSTQEMEQWRRDFNTIIVLLKNWNELPYAQSMVTDL